MTDTDALGKELRDGLVGVTPGGWSVCQHMKGKSEDEACPCGYRGGIWSGDGELQVCEMGTTIVKGEEGLEPPIPNRDATRRNAQHIARCSPENIAALLDRIEALTTENAALREAVTKIKAIPMTDTELVKARAHEVWYAISRVHWGQEEIIAKAMRAYAADCIEALTAETNELEDQLHDHRGD